tara:strand:+ start:3191 stop:4297 length:1107 start_codon:yes stop_codon:yes gene_type:complete
MNVFFRTDASISIGTGHVMRCLSLAEELKICGCNTVFISRVLPGHIINILEDKNHKVVKLKAPACYAERSGERDDYSDWLGVDWEEDVEETSEAIKSLGVNPDWLVVDHYGLDKMWECKMRDLVKFILVIDGPAKKHHDCDILLNQNYLPGIESTYEEKLPKNADLLLGPKYALLQKKFGNIRKQLQPKKNDIKRVLVFYGGIDHANETTKALQALEFSCESDTYVDVIIGENCPHKEKVEELVKQLRQATLFVQVDNVAPLMQKANLSLGAGGTTTWERMCLGLPSIVTAVAENQSISMNHLKTTGAILWLGETHTVSAYDISSSIKELYEHPNQLEVMSKLGMKMVDGYGVPRVIDQMKSYSERYN